MYSIYFARDWCYNITIMSWNKTNPEKVNQIVLDLKGPYKTYLEIALVHGISEWLVGSLCNQFLTEDEKKARYSKACQYGKLGNKNPMFGKCGKSHHNYVETVRSSGYQTTPKPLWWTGKTVKSNRIMMHHFVWASFYGQTCLPPKCVIHHIDLNLDNNDISNLQLLTVSEHMQLHAAIRKVQRLERKLVGNSVPEAHDAPRG